MQYESIILELMSRIKKLEEEVAILKSMIENYDRAEECSQNSSTTEKNKKQDSYRKMTDEMVEACYQCGKRFNKGVNISELSNMVANETGMNRNSAIMYIYAVSSLLEGTVFKRAISSKALKKYYDIILNEYGSEGLKKAIKATRLHIDYRKECGLTADTIEELCNSYDKRL